MVRPSWLAWVCLGLIVIASVGASARELDTRHALAERML